MNLNLETHPFFNQHISKNVISTNQQTEGPDMLQHAPIALAMTEPTELRTCEASTLLKVSRYPPKPTHPPSPL